MSVAKHALRRAASWVAVCSIAAVVLLASAPLASSHGRLLAQDARIRAQRDTLDSIRREREELEKRATQLQSTAHDLNEEVTNLDRRADATARIVNTLASQLSTITTEVDSASARVAVTEAELAAKKTALRRRVADIYKRGPLFTTQVMLSARSFGDLVARYKYLHLLALHDRALVTRVQELADQVQRDHDRLVTLQNVLEANRTDTQREEERLRGLRRERATSLTRTRQQAKQIEGRVAKLKATEAKMNGALASLEANRRRAESAKPSAARSTSTIKTSDYGKLDWPVDGPLLYTYGKAQTSTNTTIRWNGVGIKAPINTQVHSVAAGRVVSVGQLGTYGLTVIIDHGGGDYSIYGSLSHVDVRQEQTVAKGQVIGGVGVSDPEFPAHLHFEIRHGTGDGRTPAVDPVTWLRGQP